MKRESKLAAIHPGEILREEFLKPLDLTINGLARELHVPANRISQVVAGKRAITADTALRLGTYFGVSPQLWLRLQLEYELRTALHEHGAEIRRTIRPRAA